MPVHYVPDGYRTVTPYLTLTGAAEAIEWYKTVLNAEEVTRMAGPDGRIMHAEIRIGDSMIMLGEEMTDMGSRSPKTLGGTATGIMLYVDKVDEWFARATAAGATATMPPADMFWGDRYAKITDPWGHDWSLGTHIEDVPPQETMKRAEAWMKEQSG